MSVGESVASTTLAWIERDMTQPSQGPKEAIGPT